MVTRRGFLKWLWAVAAVGAGPAVAVTPSGWQHVIYSWDGTHPIVDVPGQVIHEFHDWPKMASDIKKGTISVWMRNDGYIDFAIPENRRKFMLQTA